MLNWPVLSTVTFLPLIGAAIIFLFIQGDEEIHKRNMRHVALGVTTVTFLVSLLIWIGFDPANPGFQFVERAEWLGGFMSYHMGVDGISMLFVILTTSSRPSASKSPETSPTGKSPTERRTSSSSPSALPRR